MSIKNPRNWRYTWEAQSHSPTLRLFLFDSHTKPSTQCKNLNAQLKISQSQLLVTWNEEEDEDTEEASLRVPIPRVLIDTESPINFRVLDDHIEVKLVLLLPVDHPIVSSFDSVLNLSEDDAVSDTAKPLVMDYDLRSISSMEEVHFYCRSCSTRLTSSPLSHFLEMPSVNWPEVADNWFGGCCCSFGGISEKLVTRYANSYACANGVCLLNVTTVTLSKDDLVEFRLPDLNKTQEYQCKPNFSVDGGSSEATLDSGSTQERGSSCDNQSESTLDFSSDQGSNGNFAAETKCEVTQQETNGNQSFCTKPVPDFSEDLTSEPGCCVHPPSHCCNDFDEVSIHDASESSSVGQKIMKSMELVENKKDFLNGFLGNVFMARSFSLSTNIKWVEFVCPHCSSLLGAYPCGNGDAPIDGGVRLFKCYISTSLLVGGSSDVFRKYTLERMFANQLVESAKDELSFRTVVRDLTTKSPELQVVLLNPNSWHCSGYCLGTEETMESALKSDLCPIVKVLFSDCNSSTESQLRMLENWVTKNSAVEVFILKSQIKELIEFLASANELLPPSCSFLQGLPVSSVLR